jgi:hypothetical protein
MQVAFAANETGLDGAEYGMRARGFICMYTASLVQAGQCEVLPTTIALY